jgi:hypothetical protein
MREGIAGGIVLTDGLLPGPCPFAGEATGEGEALTRELISQAPP